MKQAVSFIVQGRFYISLAALLLFIQSSLLFKNQLPSWAMCSFIFFATLFAYNIYYIDMKKPTYAYHKLTTIIAALASSVLFFLCYKEIHWGVFIVLIIAGTIYTFADYFPFRIFTMPLTKIILLTLVWALATVVVPMSVNIPTSGAFILFIVHQFLFVFILNLIFDIKDIEFDEKLQKRSLATRYGEKTSYAIIQFIQIILLIIIGYLFLLGKSILSPYLVPMLLGNIALTYCIRKMKNKKDIFPFLVYVDGLMILQPILLISTYYLSRF